MVARDLIHQTALEDRQPVAETNNDVAPEVFFGLEEQAVRILGRVLWWESFELAVDLLNALRRDHVVHIAEPTLFNGEQIPVGVAQIDDVVNERHEQIQFCPAPEIVGLLRPRRVLHDRVGYRLHKLRLGVQTVQTVPAVRMLHIQKVYRFHIEAVLPEIRGKTFKQFSLGVRNERGLTALCAAHEERNDEPAGLTAARRADAE